MNVYSFCRIEEATQDKLSSLKILFPSCCPVSTPGVTKNDNDDDDDDDDDDAADA